MAIHRSIYEKSVFLDTGALIALRNEADVCHRRAESCLRAIQEKNLPAYTSNVTIIETHKRILFDMSYGEAIRFLKYIYSGDIHIVRLVEEDEYEARRIITKFSDQDFTFADAINFSIMKRYGIGKAFTFDKHYQTFGFAKIPPFY